jgi:outer membrane biosynthesis protein TonB
MKQEFKPLDAPPEPESEPPPGPPALDAAGEGPGDAFGLAGRPGGGEYLGGAGGGGGSPFARYAAMVQQKAQQSVERQSRLRASRFRVTVKLWFEPDGSTQRVEIETSTGDAEIDKLLESSLMAMEKLADGPPKGMPQPVVLRVSTS